MIGARIKGIRAKKRISQERLAERMKINHKYLSSIERGKENPTLNTLIKLSESLEVDLDEIFSLVQIEDPAKRMSLIISLLDKADSEQLKINHLQNNFGNNPLTVAIYLLFKELV